MTTGRATQLAASGVPFVEAVVVRSARPSSARPGDRAVVLGDGTIEGFVGGSCADATVRLQALRALETGEPVLVRILPGEHDGPSEEEGSVTVANPCLSGGALEVFLEPRLPAPRVLALGETPVARALESLGPAVGFDVRRSGAPEATDLGVVVATLGHGDEEALQAALESGASYVGLVASPRRGAAVLEALRAAGLSDELLARVRTPAGLDLGARTPEEIALSILAELVTARRRPAVPSAPGPARAPETATDPVCGMQVAVGPGTPVAEHAGRRVAFCSEGCRDAFVAEPERYAAAR